MKTYARIQGGVVLSIEPEVVTVDGQEWHLNDRLHPAIVAECQEITTEQAQEVRPGWIFADGTFSAPPPPAVQAPSGRTLKSDVWRRATDDEAGAMDAMLNAAPAKLRRLWADSTILEHDSPEFAAVRDPIVAAFGAERADALLAPSPGA
jgi:hypothetical protein